MGDKTCREDNMGENLIVCALIYLLSLSGDPIAEPGLFVKTNQPRVWRPVCFDTVFFLSCYQRVRFSRNLASIG